MNILIITTYFPPDTAIASVRPYMFAKYLRKNGHEVTVIRSGELSKSPDHALPYDKFGISVYSYLGDDSPAERYMRGDWETSDSNSPRSRIWFLPYAVRKYIASAFHKIEKPLTLIRCFRKTKSRFEQQKKCIDRLQSEQFDVVFATYGELENIYAGRYAAQVFHCKWILDFRDPIARRITQNRMEYALMKRIQDKAVLSADLCTAVSDGVGKEISLPFHHKQIITLYNGYDKTGGSRKETSSLPELRICYTGSLYIGHRDASKLFQVLQQLHQQGKLDLENVFFDYAGYGFAELFHQASGYHVEQILVDHGYVSRTETEALQRNADIFLVLSWNTKWEQGVLTGKFYEGIRCEKPILALVTGDKPHSELWKLNQKYNYGFCYEDCQGEKQLSELREWVWSAYYSKITGNQIPYTPTPSLSKDFCYDTLSAQLEKLCYELSQDVNSAECGN